jgi:hypothetical protein
MLTPHSLRILVLSPLLVAPAFAASFTLTGTQADAALVMSKGNTYTVKGDYVVPAGKKLEIGPGAVINAEKGAGITVKGELLVNADEKAPAIARGKGWKGIHAGEESKSSVTGLQVTGADIGLRIEGTVDVVKACVFSKNAKGLKLDGKGKVSVENCLVADNTSDGMRLTSMSGTVTGCSFLRNKGFGITVGESNPKFEKCLFSENVMAGIEQSNASSASSMNGTECAFDGKGLSIQSGMSHGSLDFQKCFWGDKATAYLKSKGDKGAIPNLKDARAGGGSLKVYLLGFLSSAPKPCGASVASKL